MSLTFTKLFAAITESTVWFEPDGTRIVWITMLAMADQYGRVLGSVPGLAHRARVPVEATRDAIASFLQPDPDSRTKDYEGRRIEVIDGGWRLLNHGKYRDLRNDDDRREQNRIAQARHREREANKVAGSSASVSISQQSKPRSAQAESDALSKEKEEKTTTAAPAPRRAPEGALSVTFLKFWNAYPAIRRRKGGMKARAAVVWNRMNLDSRGEWIVRHVRDLAASPNWADAKFIPTPVSYLEKQFWDGAEVDGEEDPFYASVSDHS